MRGRWGEHLVARLVHDEGEEVGVCLEVVELVEPPEGCDVALVADGHHEGLGREIRFQERVEIEQTKTAGRVASDRRTKRRCRTSPDLSTKEVHATTNDIYCESEVICLTGSDGDQQRRQCGCAARTIRKRSERMRCYSGIRRKRIRFSVDGLGDGLNAVFVVLPLSLMGYTLPV